MNISFTYLFQLLICLQFYPVENNDDEKFELNKDVTGFTYTNMTCAFDTLLTAFLMIYQSECLEKREIFSKTMPYLTSTFDRVLNKSLTYAEGKEHILSTFFFEEERFKRGCFQMIGDVVESALRSQTIASEEEDENYFQLNYHQILTCHSEVCSIRDPKETHDKTNSIVLHTDLDHTSSMNYMIEQFFAMNRRHYSCKTCSIKMEEKWVITKLPRVLYIACCGKDIEFDIDREIILENVAYQLMAVIYSGSGHFMSRMMVNNCVVEYDGMVSGGSFRKINSVNAFNGNIIDLRGFKRAAFQIFYRRKDETY